MRPVDGGRTERRVVSDPGASAYPAAARLSPQIIPSRRALPGDDHIEQLFESVEPLVPRDRVDRGAGDEGALVLVAILHLDPERDLPGSCCVDPQGTFGPFARRERPGAFEQDTVPAEVADDRCYRLLLLRHRECEVLPARIRNFMPPLFSIVDLHMAAASGNADAPDATLPVIERFCSKRSARTFWNVYR